MKKVFFALMCLVSLIVMTACGGGNAKKDASGETAEVKKEAKAKEWPKNEWTNLVNKPENVTITSYGKLSYTDGYIVKWKEWSLEAAEAYIEDVKKSGFNLESKWGNMTFNYDNARKAHRFNSMNSSEIHIEIWFTPEDKTGSIKFSKDKDK